MYSFFLHLHRLLCFILLHSHQSCYIEVMILCGCALVLLCNGFSWSDRLPWKSQWRDLRAQNRHKTHIYLFEPGRSESSKQQNLVKSRIQWSLRTKGDVRSLIHANETMFTGFFSHLLLHRHNSVFFVLLQRQHSLPVWLVSNANFTGVVSVVPFWILTSCVNPSLALALSLSHSECVRLYAVFRAEHSLKAKHKLR